MEFIKRFKLCYALLLSLQVLFSCNKKPEGLKWNDLIIKYSTKKSDSLYLAAAIFLKENSLNERFQKTNSFKFFPDSIAMTNKQVERNIENQVDDWVQHFSGKGRCWEQFLNYVLPYKVLNEYPEDWRLKIRKNYYAKLRDIKKDSLYEYEIIKFFNRDVKSWFKFNPKISPRSWTELSSIKQGDCVSISSLMSFLGRSYGIPITIDYCPVWSNINSSMHCWNTLLQSNGKNIPFMGIEGNPKEYDPFLLFKTICSAGDKSTFKESAKVFRQTFSIQKNSLQNFVKSETDLPNNLYGEKYIDVTNEYYKIKDVAIYYTFNKQSPAYLCVYNKGKWIPTWWAAPLNTKKAVFKNMAVPRLYLPAFFSTGETIPFMNPLVVNENNTILLNPCFKKRIALKIRYLNSIEQEQIEMYNQAGKLSWKKFVIRQNEIALGKHRKAVSLNKLYSLFYWNKGWIKFKTKKCRKSEIEFTNVPSNSLFKIVSEQTQNLERIFTWQNGKQVWW